MNATGPWDWLGPLRSRRRRAGAGQQIEQLIVSVGEVQDSGPARSHTRDEPSQAGHRH